MLQPTTALVNGILVLTGTQHFVPGLTVRPSARQLRDRRNAVYAEATRSGNSDLAQRMVEAHAAAEDYTIRVCEAVLGPRLVAYVEAYAERCMAAIEGTGSLLPPTPAPATKRPARKTRDRKSQAVLDSVIDATREARRCGHRDDPMLADAPCAYDTMGMCVL